MTDDELQAFQKRSLWRRVTQKLEEGEPLRFDGEMAAAKDPSRRCHDPEEDVAALLAEVIRLQERHALALQVIEQYQIDIRDRELDQKGFCQGEYYRESSRQLGIRWVES